MKRKLLAFTINTILILLLPLICLADSRRYTPPAERGEIYIVIRYKQTFGPQPTQVSINWGNWQKNDTFNPPNKLLLPGSGVPEGIVVKLRHTKNDSVEMGINSNGSIGSVSQGNPPSEWNRKEYQKINW